MAEDGPIMGRYPRVTPVDQIVRAQTRARIPARSPAQWLTWAAAVAIAMAAASGCQSSEPTRPDESLGGLVIPLVEPPAPIDVTKAATDPAELVRALLATHSSNAEALGPHRFVAESKTELSEGTTPLETLVEHRQIQYASASKFFSQYENDAGYGREAIFVDGTLYLRPRYGKYNRRLPESAEEPPAICDENHGSLGAYADLLAPGMEITDKGESNLDGRTVRVIAVGLKKGTQTPASESLAHKQWRASRQVNDLSGEITLDVKTGAALSAKLAGTVGFSRDGKRLTMRVSIDHKLSLQAPEEIRAPDPSECVDVFERRTEVDERDQLLDGIAPKTRKGGGAGSP